MLKIGQFNTLEVVKSVDFGYYLDGGPYGEILLPTSQSPDEDLEDGSEIKVFIYTDTEDRLIATTLYPRIIVGEFAYLPVKQNGPNGAYLDWGLEGKDLLVPFREQTIKMQEGQSYIVSAYLDEQTDRLAATARLSNLLEDKSEGLEAGDSVDLLAVTTSDLGWKMIVNNTYWGMLFFSDVFQPIKRGDRFQGFIKNVREDQKLDLSLQKSGYEQVSDTAEWLLAFLQRNDGFLPLTDKSPPEVIYETLKVSKKVFKKAVGNLYKKRIILLDENGIRLQPVTDADG